MKLFGLEEGNYILVASGRTAEYSPVLSITGIEELQEVNTFTFTLYDGYDDHKKGRGCGITKIYTMCLKEEKQLTFSVAASNVYDYLNAVARLSIYQFK